MTKKAADLRARLAEAEEVLRAIRNGEVDGVVVAGSSGSQVYTLSGADRVYRQLIETMSEGALALSAGGVILYCNAQFAQLLDRPLDQVVGSALRSHLLPSEHKGCDEILTQARTQPSRRELSLKAGGDRLVPVHLAASRLEGEGEEIVFCLVVTDLTEIRAKTAQVEKANRELEAFTTSVSHDLRAPLRALVGYSEMLMRDHSTQLEPEGSRLVELVDRRARAMGKLVDDLLAFSQLGRKTLTRSAVSVAEVVRASLETLEEQGRGRRLSFKVGKFGPCQGDPALLQQLWLNLLGNAIKFTRGCPEAVIEVDSHDEAGETVYRVKDNGAGFDMRDIDKLFKVFERLHSKEEYEGTGVGLAIVARIVEGHGGRIWARATPGQGAEFLFTLAGPRT